MTIIDIALIAGAVALVLLVGIILAHIRIHRLEDEIGSLVHRGDYNRLDERCWQVVRDLDLIAAHLQVSIEDDYRPRRVLKAKSTEQSG